MTRYLEGDVHTRQEENRYSYMAEQALSAPNLWLPNASKDREIEYHWALTIPLLHSSIYRLDTVNERAEHRGTQNLQTDESIVLVRVTINTYAWCSRCGVVLNMSNVRMSLKLVNSVHV